MLQLLALATDACNEAVQAPVPGPSGVSNTGIHPNLIRELRIYSDGMIAVDVTTIAVSDGY